MSNQRYAYIVNMLHVYIVMHQSDAVSYHCAMALARNASGGQEIEVEPPYSVNVIIKPKGWIVPVVAGTGDQKVKGKEETTMTHMIELAFSLTFDKSHTGRLTRTIHVSLSCRSVSWSDRGEYAQ